MPRQQRTYSKEWKQEAVRLVNSSGKPITQIARELGMSDSALSRMVCCCSYQSIHWLWVRQPSHQETLQKE